MCVNHHKTALAQAMDLSAIDEAQTPSMNAQDENVSGSTRTPIWQLPDHAHCPVVGVCLSMPHLQILLKKSGWDIKGTTLYQQHQIAVGESRHKTRLADIIQRELDKSFDLTIQQLRKLREPQALKSAWELASSGPQWAGMFWAVITHPKANKSLIDGILGDVHMLQHQVGMTVRQEQHQAFEISAQQRGLKQDVQKLQERIESINRRLQEERHQWEKDLAAAQERVTQANAQAQQNRQALEHWLQVNADFVEQHQLAEDNAALREQVNLLERTIKKSSVNVPNEASTTPESLDHPSPKQWQWLKEPQSPIQTRCVACVGGTTAQAPAYRDIMQRTGVAFVHHDGGQEHHLAKLGTCLSQADLVICQTGCISHNAYWRVKEHCKRTGTPCVFVGNPSAESFKKALQEIVFKPQAA
jgi:hypothetical protein